MHDFAEIEKRVRDDEVTGLDAYESGNAEAPTLYRSVSHTVKATTGGKPLVFIASTQDEDRAGDVIQAKGWQLDRFRENPVYQWSHDYSSPPIGMVPRIWKSGTQLRNNVKFDSGNAFAADIERKFRDGFLKAQSVGFKALEFEARETAKGGNGFLFTAAELLEISAVAIPMNQAALMKAYEHAAKAPAFFFMGDAFNTKREEDGMSKQLRDAVQEITAHTHSTWPVNIEDEPEDEPVVEKSADVDAPETDRPVDWQAEIDKVREEAFEDAVELVSGVFVDEAIEDEPESSIEDEQVSPLLSGFASALQDFRKEED